MAVIKLFFIVVSPDSSAKLNRTHEEFGIKK